MIRILYVDDEPEILTLGKEFLEMNNGFQVDTVKSVPQALLLIAQHPYDAIISDYVMPDMTGLDFLTQVRSLDPKIPFIIFTGQGNESVVIEALNQGVDFYLKKRYDQAPQFSELAQIIRILVSRTHSDKQLRESEEKFRTLSDSVSIGVLMYQNDLWIYANPAAEKISGYISDELLSMHFWDIARPDFQESLKTLGHKRQHENQSQIQNLEIVIIRRDGEERWIDLSANTVIIGNKNVGLITATDITDRKNIEKKLAYSEEKYRSIFENQTDLYYQTDIDGIITDLSPSCEFLTGWSQEDLIGHSVLDLYQQNPDQRKSFTDKLTRDGVVYDFESTLINARGVMVPISINSHVIFDELGSPVSIEGTIRDISKRKMTEEALQRSEEHYRSLFDNMMEGFAYCQMIYDSDGSPVDWIYLQVNKAFERITGLSNINGKRVSEVIPGTKEETPELFEIYNRVVQSGDPEKFEINFTPLDSWLMVSVYRPEDGHFVATFEDITTRKQSEILLRKLITDHQTILENVPAMIWYKDTKNNFIKVNPAAAQVFGKPISEIEGKNFSELFPGQPDSYYSNDIEIISTGSSKLGVIESITTAQGNHLRVQTDKVPLRDHQGNVIGVLVVSVDITEREKVRDAITLANKKLNLLSSITRHDIVNQLQGLFFSLDMANSQDSDPEVQKYVEKAENFAHNIERQIAFTRDYQDIGLNSPVWQDVKPIIARAIKSIHTESVAIHIHLPDMKVYADPLLEKVFFNLIDNAIRYGEKISEIRFFGEEIQTGYTLFCVDDGVGIPAEYKLKIFNREYFKHTGFGLNLSREILEITGITISETGEEGKGARFELLVPKGGYRLLTNLQKSSD